MDFNFPCPNCSQELLCSTDHIGLALVCPVCAGELIVPRPPASAPPAKEPVTHWIADVRILIQRAPPVYIRMLIEVPRAWALPQDGSLPPSALALVKHAVSARYPQCPVTPLRVRIADSESAKCAGNPARFSNDTCKVWPLGMTPATV